MYRAYSTQPSTRPTGELAKDRKTGEETRWHAVTWWRELGTVKLQDPIAALQWAKERWGGSPVLEEIGTIH